jgi:citrate lyase subunit beta/citryl-CoA lyase
MIATAAASAADVVVLDLEDSVPPQRKTVARNNAVRGLLELDWGRKTRAVRINAHDTEWAHGDVIDLVTQAGGALDVLVLPKVKQPRDVWWVETLLDQLELRLQRRTPVGLAVLIEEVEAVQNIDAIARSTPRLEALILGTGDLARSQGARPSVGGSSDGDLWVYPKTRVLFAARAAGLEAIDGPYSGRIDDLDGFRSEALRANTLGFTGKWAIHPAQISVANEVYSPTAAEIQHARRLIDAYNQALARGTGAVQLHGEMVDEAHARAALYLLARADLVGVSGGGKVVGEA